MKKKLIVVISLIIVAIIMVIAVFISNISNLPSNQISKNEYYTNNIIDPDRIVYRNQEGKYFEFLKDTDEYNQIKNLIADSIEDYNSNGSIVEDSEIKELHKKSFLEFDYKTASKNYIIPLEEKEKNIIKLANTGGNICVNRLKNLNKIKKKVNNFSEDKKEYNLEYKQMISRNTLTTIEYKYLKQFKEINYKIHQIKIENIDDYELYKQMCRLAFEEEITEEIFDNNVLILTLSLVPKIDVEVNIGNIRYTYNKLEDVNYQYTAHLLVVSKIVNTDCIYNTDLAEIESKVQYDNMVTDYDKKVEELETNIFVINFDEFFKEYENSNNEISEKEAKDIAEIGFKEAQRVAGSYDANTEEVTIKEVRPNNFFTRKMNEGDSSYDEKVEAYCFTRVDDMQLNGVTIYVDKKLGKIIGANAFGD
ncbi:MAG: hypothetical protein ACI4UE_00435 [Candidatus Scatovivens sp.]